MATGNGRPSRKRQTICQKSTAIAANLVRSSSSLLAKITLGLLTRGPKAPPELPQDRSKAPPELPQDPSKSMVRVERVSPSTDDVNSLATKYINKVKERNKPREPGAVADGSNLTRPPPSNKRVTDTR